MIIKSELDVVCPFCKAGIGVPCIKDWIFVEIHRKFHWARIEEFTRMFGEKHQGGDEAAIKRENAQRLIAGLREWYDWYRGDAEYKTPHQNSQLADLLEETGVVVKKGKEK